VACVGGRPRGAHGTSRALALFNPELRSGLRKNGFLTRDSRHEGTQEVRTEGRPQRFQFSKRRGAALLEPGRITSSGPAGCNSGRAKFTAGKDRQ